MKRNFGSPSERADNLAVLFPKLSSALKHKTSTYFLQKTSPQSRLFHVVSETALKLQACCSIHVHEMMPLH